MAPRARPVGQVFFPGGLLDPGDWTDASSALPPTRPASLSIFRAKKGLWIEASSRIWLPGPARWGRCSSPVGCLIRAIGQTRAVRFHQPVRRLYLSSEQKKASGLRPLHEYGSPGRTRTSDQLINSQPLYQLSYRGMVRGGILGQPPGEVKPTAPVLCACNASSSSFKDDANDNRR